MEEQRFVVPQEEFNQYSEIASKYRSAVQTRNERLKLQYKQQNLPYPNNPSEEKELSWARSELRKQDPKEQVIAKRILAQKAESDELKRQETDNHNRLDKIFAVEAAMYEWAWNICVEANKNKRVLKNSAEWNFVTTVFDFLARNAEIRDLNMRFTLTQQFASGLVSDARRFRVRTVEVIDLRCEEMKELPSRSPTNQKYDASRDRTIKFSYHFMDTKARVSHSREKSAAWIKQNLQSDKDGNYTRKKLVLLFALYMGINHIESRLSMELESKLIHALGRSDLLDRHQNHEGRAGRLSFSRKSKDFIAQELKKSLLDVLSAPTQNGNKIDYVPDANITKKSLKLLVRLAECVSKLETSFSFRKHGPHIEGTLDVIDRAYDRLYSGKGHLNGVSGLAKDTVLPESVTKLLQDKDPVYLPPRYRSQARTV